MIAALLDELKERHGLTPAHGLQLIAGPALLLRPFDPGWPLLVVAAEPAPSVADPSTIRTPDSAAAFDASVVPGRAAGVSGPASLLRHLYPPEHPVHGVGGSADTTVGALTDQSVDAGGWLIPPLTEQRNVASPHGLPWLVARLRAPGGCPWDAEQDHQSLRKFVLEEAYEVYDALEGGSTPALAEELGDLLLQVVLHAQYAAEDGVFDLADVYRSVVTKIVHRHPHVFGDVTVSDSDEVLRNWEVIKAGERAAAAEDGTSQRPRDGTDEMPAAFAGLSRSLPALHYAQEMQERAAALGYDWPDVEGVIDKLEEEAIELLQANDQAERNEEFGDLLLVIVNLGRKLGLDAEASLRQASAKFARRFRTVERLAADDGTELSRLTFEDLDDLWQRAKRLEREPASAADPAISKGDA